MLRADAFGYPTISHYQFVRKTALAPTPRVVLPSPQTQRLDFGTGPSCRAEDGVAGGRAALHRGAARGSRDTTVGERLRFSGPGNIGAHNYNRARNHKLMYLAPSPERHCSAA